MPPTPPNNPGQPKKPTPPPPQTKGAAPGKPMLRPAAPSRITSDRPAAGGARAAGRSRRGYQQDSQQRMAEALVDLGFLNERQVTDLLPEANSLGESVGQLAQERGLITADQLLQATAEVYGMKSVPLAEIRPQPEALQLVPETMASVFKVLPLLYQDNVLTVAVADPTNLTALDNLRNFLNIPNVQAVLASQKDLEEGLARCYAGKEESIVDIIDQLENDPKLRSRRNETAIDLGGLMEIQDAAPVRKLINMVLLMAIRDHASDIHFEPFEDEFKMRYRCDGVLYEMVPPPRHLAMAISSRIKVMANLDIAERRLPQDGRIELNVGGNAVDLRVSVLPTMFGESIVIRVLDRTVVNLDLNKVGLEAGMLAKFRELIHKPNGIVLVTGPTGAGKTTTLYSALNELNQVTEKVITTEDPVEYELDGIVQCQIHSEIDLTFASALRSILRQDPDIILVGEIRDLETAQIAVQASLTGHLVFSTLHTNDAPSTITRLRDMGVEPYLLTATLEGILAQRLVRRICTECRTEFQPSAEMLMELNLRPAQVQGKKFYYGQGCDRCNNTGHRGRCGLFELIVIDDDIRDQISQGASTDKLRQVARQKGVSGLRDAGLRAIFNGVTTIEEVVRETVLEDDSY